MLDLATRRSKHTLTHEIIDVTPEIAKAWLDHNKNNRRVNKPLVARLASDMKAKRWHLTGDPVRFDTSKTLIDGQHRLLACIEAGVPFQTVVLYDLPAGTKDVIDTGKARSAADVLGMHGLTNTTAVAAAYRSLYAEKNGGRLPTSGHIRMTHSEMLALVKKHPDLPLYMLAPGSLPRGLPHSYIGFLYYVGATLLNKRSRAQAMIAVLKSGTPDYENCPMHLYRERIIRSDAAIRRLPCDFWSLKHCWNLFSKKEPMAHLKWRTTPVSIDGLDVKDL